LGKECLIGANVTITDTDFHAIKPEGRRFNGNPQDIGAEPVCVADNVFIGTGAIVLKGVSVGKNSVIGAMSVVSKHVDTNVIVAGAPIHLIRKIDNDL
jgi:acetyltransferase-like isoleucine patch superfamily enzyme